MDLLGKARKLETRISRSLDLAVTGLVGRSPRRPVEIVQEVLDAAEQQVQPAGRGRRVFPYNQITVQVVAATRAEKAQFEAVAVGPPSLQQRVVERLRVAGCHVGALEVRTVYVSRPKADWTEPEFHVGFNRAETGSLEAPATPASPLRLEISVVVGSAERRAYAFSGGRIAIGRRADVLDHRQQLIRRNQVAFIDGENEANRSVSRRHAHIACNPESREWRVHDDGSSRGTAVLRAGRTIRVPPGARGIRLESGDEVALGDARLRVKFR